MNDLFKAIGITATVLFVGLAVLALALIFLHA